MEQRKDVYSVWVHKRDFAKFDRFIGAEKLLHMIGWLVAMCVPWWIFVRIGDALEGSFLRNWIGWPLVLIVLANSFFWIGYLMSRIASMSGD